MKYAKGSGFREDWNIHASIGSCDHCFSDAVRVQYVSDPYNAEINEIDERSDFCYDCYKKYAEEI